MFLKKDWNKNKYIIHYIVYYMNTHRNVCKRTSWKFKRKIIFWRPVYGWQLWWSSIKSCQLNLVIIVYYYNIREVLDPVVWRPFRVHYVGRWRTCSKTNGRWGRVIFTRDDEWNVILQRAIHKITFGYHLYVQGVVIFGLFLKWNKNTRFLSNKNILKFSKLSAILYIENGKHTC